MKREWYRIEAKAQEDAADTYIFGDIGKSFWDDDTVTASKFIADLNALPTNVKTVRVHVNSFGGNVFEAHAIANALRVQRAEKGRTVEMIIEGIAASAATIVTSAGSPIRIADNAMMMIHEPEALEWGTASALRKMADALDGVKNSIIAAYRWVSQKTEKELSAMMTEGTWMDPAEAVENGLATEIIQGVQATARLSAERVGRLGAVPEKFRARIDALIEKPLSPPVAAEPAALMAACQDAGLDLVFAHALVTAQVTLEEGRARIAAEQAVRVKADARASEIRALCAHAKLPELATGYLGGAMDPESVRAHLTILTAKLDRVEINGSLLPDADGRAKPRIDVNAVYAARNRLTAAKEH